MSEECLTISSDVPSLLIDQKDLTLFNEFHYDNNEFRCYYHENSFFLIRVTPKESLVELRRLPELTNCNNCDSNSKSETIIHELRVKWFSLNDGQFVLACVYRTCQTHNHMDYFVVWSKDNVQINRGSSWQWELPDDRPITGDEVVEKIYGTPERMYISEVCNSSSWFLVDSNDFLEQEQLVNYSLPGKRIHRNK